MSGEEDKTLSSDSIPVQICGRSVACNVAAATAMPASLVQSTKRALVSLLKSLAVKFLLVINITCDSHDAEVQRAYTRATACLCSAA